MKKFYGAFLKNGIFLFLLSLTVSSEMLAQCVTDPVTNLVRNGNFSSGATGFISGYSRCTTSNCLYPEGYYAIGTNANFYHNAFVGRDHTTGTQNFMIVNGAGVPNTIVWSQTITVKAGTDYNFSAWISTLVASSPARLQFAINGVPIGAIFNAPATSNTWQSFFVTWNSGASTSAVITILNQNTTLAGNDFGVDDITFVEICPTPIPNLGPDQTLCGVGTILLNTNIPHNSTTSVTWSDGTTGLGLGAPYTKTINAGGSYWVCVKDGACVKTDTINIIADFSVDIGPDFTLCAQTAFKVDAGYQNSFTTYKWYKNLALIPDSTNRTFTVRSPGLYKVEVYDASCGTMRWDEVQVNSVSAIPNDGTFCPPAQAVFSVTPNPTGGFKWYNAANGGTVMGKGNSISVSGSGTMTMYAQDTTSFQYNVGPNAKFPDGFTNGASLGDYIQFDAHSAFTLKSVTVFALVYTPYENITVGVTLLDNLGNIIQQVQRVVTGPPIIPADHVWPFTVAVGFNITPGNDYRLSNYGTIGDLFWASGAGNNVLWSSYKETGIITFKEMGPGYDYCTDNGRCYGYFYNWEIEKGNNCARVPVVVTENCPAPVEWLDFTVKANSNKNTLKWSTASEKNVSHFIIERSFDGLLFQPISTVKAQGNTLFISEYSYVDEDYNHEIIYYRIKEMDFNGDNSHTPVKSVERAKSSSMQIQPNPTTGVFTISVFSEKNSEITISVLNTIGQVLVERNGNLVNGTMYQTMEMTSFPQGVYIIRVQSENELLTESFVKE